MEIKNKRPSHQELKKEAFKNPEVRKEYDRLAPFYKRHPASYFHKKEKAGQHVTVRLLYL